MKGIRHQVTKDQEPVVPGETDVIFDTTRMTQTLTDQTIIKVNNLKLLLIKMEEHW